MIALWFAACGVPAERTASPDAVFPHPSAYGDEGDHGPDALASGAECLTCHAVDEGAPVRGAAPSAPACRSCHADFPHVAGFGTSADHGVAWLGRPGDCVDCHGADGARAPADQADGVCASCHSSYPHAAGWAAPTSHGAAALARGKGSCETCHADSVGAEAGQCTACHAVYPHAAGWDAAHGAAYTPETCTASCHPAQAAPPRVACASCHDLFPHAEGWPAGHIAVVQGRGEGACAQCHEPGTPAGPVLPVSCGATCHGGGAK